MDRDRGPEEGAEVEEKPDVGRTPAPTDSNMVMVIRAAPPSPHGDGTGMSTPEAAALLEGASALIARNPDRFPLQGMYAVGLTVRSAAEFPDEDHEDPIIIPIEEILVSAGVLEFDVVDWDSFQIDPELTDGYSIEIDYHP